MNASVALENLVTYLHEFRAKHGEAAQRAEIERLAAEGIARGGREAIFWRAFMTHFDKKPGE